MLVLALDTATDAVSVGLLTVGPAEQVTVLAEQVRPGARRHGEQLMPAVLEVCAAAGHRLDQLDAVVCGTGPGPFTGLRVGLVSAAGLADALEVPAYGVCSLDAVASAAVASAAVASAAVASAAGAGEPLLVLSDARRREVYWAAYDGSGRRVHGPSVDTPGDLAQELTTELTTGLGGLGIRRVAGPAAEQHAELLGLPEYRPGGVPLLPSPSGLLAPVLDALCAGREPPPLEPYYLRRPDAVEPGARKRVSPPRTEPAGRPR